MKITCKASAFVVWAAARRAIGAGALVAMTLSGCGTSTPDKVAEAPAADRVDAKPSEGSANSVSSGSKAEGGAAAKSPESAPASSDSGTSPKAAAADAVDDEVRSPATVDEAAKVLDLREFPLPEGANQETVRAMASAFYEAKGETKAIYEFLKKQFIERKWKVLAHESVTDESASGAFSREGFMVSLSVFPSKPGAVNVSFHCHGNVNLRMLAVPSGTKLEYSFPAVTAYSTDVGLKESVDAVRKLFIDDGWAPYGTAGDSMSFKKNAVLVNARVFTPPAQPGKTSISYSSTLLSVDLPAPAEATRVDYADQLKQLYIEAPSGADATAEFYRTALGAAGWKPVTDHPVKDRRTQFWYFRNAANDLISLEMQEVAEEKLTRSTLRHRTAAEEAAAETRAKAKIAERERKEEERKNRPKPKATITLPVDAQDVAADGGSIEFKLPTGQAKASLAVLIKELEVAGWKAGKPDGDSMAGRIELKRNTETIAITYVDPGLIPAEIDISASGVVLESKK